MKKRKRLFAWINILLFVALLSATGVIFLTAKHRATVSEVEKRKLAWVPHFSWKSFFTGAYMDSLDLYMADNFPQREKFVSLAFDIKENRGIRSNKVKFYHADLLKKPMNTVKQGPVKDSAGNAAPADTNLAAQIAQDFSNIIIYNGMAIQLFGGNNKMAASYANVINKYQRALVGKGVTVYDVVVPSTADLYLPDEYKKMSGSEKRNIDAIYANLAPGVKAVDAYTPMMAHRDEYLFFNTDHHWTGRGAYYAYAATVTAAGMTPLQFDNMERKVRRNWLGSLYALTKDEVLRNNPDSAEYWKVPGRYKTWRYTDNAIEKPIPTTLYAEYGWGYGVFLGGDFPLMKIETENNTGRSVVIIKNSFGNAFSTYFVGNFDKVFIIDYRYYNHSLLDLIEKNGITDLVFLNNSFSANTSWHLYRMEKIMFGGSKPAVPVDSTKKPAPDTADVRKDSVVIPPQEKK
jgi:hypothetical protein